MYLGNDGNIYADWNGYDRILWGESEECELKYEENPLKLGISLLSNSDKISKLPAFLKESEKAKREWNIQDSNLIISA